MNWRRRNRLRNNVIDAREVERKARPYGAFYQGSMAHKRGLSPVVCPFVLDTDDQKAWFAGWLWDRETV